MLSAHCQHSCLDQGKAFTTAKGLKCEVLDTAVLGACINKSFGTSSTLFDDLVQGDVQL